MDTTKWIIVAAALMSGCSATIEDPGGNRTPGAGSDNGSGHAASAGASNSAGKGNGSGAGTDSGSSCVSGIPQTSQLPRLTRAQYERTIRDLTGFASDASSMLAPDSTGSVDERTWGGYQSAAAAVAAQVMGDATARAQLFVCDPSGDGTLCARQFIQQFGQRAFRRPLTAEEATRFEALYADRAELTPAGTFEDGIQLLLEAFLVSPSFLTRAELAPTPPEGNRIPLDGYEIASRLSYMLWGSMPDQGLFEAAAAGALSTREQIVAQAKRMLASPKARAMVNGFHESYVHMGPGTRWADISRDRAIYPAFDASMPPLMNEETRRFLDHVVFEMQGTFKDLITAPIAFVNATLAPLYGLSPAQYGAELVPVTLTGSLRAGLFTRLGFLASHSLYNRTSPILRGAFIQKEVLCTPIGAPPPDAESTPLPTQGLTTNRERTDAQTSGAACVSCHHALINPTGFVFEAYDATGALQSTDNGVPIDTRATVLMGSQAVDVSGPVDLMERIAASPEARQCYAKKWVQYAYERLVTNEDACVVHDLTARLANDGYTVIDLITDLTVTETFRYRAVPEVAP